MVIKGSKITDKKDKIIIKEGRDMRTIKEDTITITITIKK